MSLKNIYFCPLSDMWIVYYNNKDVKCNISLKSQIVLKGDGKKFSNC